MANSNITDLGAAIHRLYDARALLVVLADASVRDDGSLDHLSRVIRMTSDTIDEVIAGIDEDRKSVV